MKAHVDEYGVVHLEAEHPAEHYVLTNWVGDGCPSAFVSIGTWPPDIKEAIKDLAEKTRPQIKRSIADEEGW